MDDFNKFVLEQGKPKLWYWYAEKQFWKTHENKQLDRLREEKDQEKIDNILGNWDFNWCDMCEIFKKEPIVIKDCFRFGLKSVANAMYKHDLIKTKLESECTSGMTAMIKAWKCYNNFSNPSMCPIMKDIAKYNKFDVCVLEDILNYLRKNHL
jgi:hypothetical protein